MAKAVKEKKEKLKQYKYYGFNIKLSSNENKGDLAYFNIVKALYDKDIHAMVSSDKKITLRTQFRKKLVYKENEYDILYGFIVRYAIVEGDNWYSEKKRDFEKVAIPKDVFPSPFETEYIFLPSVHRFFIKINGKVSPKMVKIFLEDALKQVISRRESVSVNLMQSYGAIQEILDADEIQRLKVEVSYTNDDIGGDAKEEIDRLLKEANIGNATVMFTPDQTGKLKEDSVVVQGFLELATENGEASATIISEGKKKRIVTKHHPAKLLVMGKDDTDAAQKLLNEQMKKNR